MSWAAIDEIPGLANVPGTVLSATQEYSLDDRFSCPAIDSNPIPHALPERQLDVDDTYAADHVAALAAYDLVQIFTDGAQIGGGCSGGRFDCSSAVVAASYVGVSVEFSSFEGNELRNGVNGTLRPTLVPGSNVTPNSNGYLMRPTALEWDGQDPLNESNRTVWLPSEVIGILGAAHFHHDMINVSSYDVHLGSGVRALNVISGSPHELGTAEPVICFV